MSRQSRRSLVKVVKDYLDRTLVRTSKECPKDWRCFHWIPPGGFAEMSGETHKSLDKAFKSEKWIAFPDGGCSCSFGKCTRLCADGEADFFEPGI